MFVAQALDVQPGQTVLDLCASPGGKATQILNALRGNGLLVANEVTSSRIKPLVFNLERFGAGNFMVTSASAEQLAKQLPGLFDRILIDAPCSGEGLFRKDPGTRLTWEPSHPEGCAKRQKDLLHWGAQMLRPGGKIVYSTCTFAEEENEWLIGSFLSDNPGFSAELPIFSEQFGLIATDPAAVKLLPHKLKGEGHFCAILRKKGNGECSLSEQWTLPRVPAEARSLWRSFANEHCAHLESSDRLFVWDDSLYLAPSHVPALKNIRFSRIGLKLGRVTAKDFFLDHALALSLEKIDLPRADFAPDDTRLKSYLRGEAIPVQHRDRGWTLVCCSGFPLGLGKISDGMLKNHLPKGLRVLKQ